LLHFLYNIIRALKQSDCC